MRVRMVVSYVHEYDLDLSVYPDGFSVDQALEMDVVNVREDPSVVTHDKAAEISVELLGDE